MRPLLLLSVLALPACDGASGGDTGDTSFEGSCTQEQVDAGESLTVDVPRDAVINVEVCGPAECTPADYVWPSPNVDQIEILCESTGTYRVRWVEP